MFLENLHSWMNRNFGAVRGQRRPGKAKNLLRQLSFETLEDRTVPTVLFPPQFGNESLGKTDAGQRINSPNVYIVLWGSSWGGISTPNAVQVDSGTSGVLFSHYLDGVGQYGVTTNAHYRGLVYDNTPDPASKFSEASMTTEIERLIANNQLPDPANTPNMIVNMVTAPNIISDQPGDGGYNNAIYQGNKLRYGYIWTGTASDANPLKDHYSLTFSHEMAELMTDPAGKGYEVKPNKKFPFTDGGSQIADYEGDRYSYRMGDGDLVQPYWSSAVNSWVITDGNAQTMTVKPNWTSPTDGSLPVINTFDVSINGGQLPQADYLSIASQVTGNRPPVLELVLNSELFQIDTNYSVLGKLTATVKNGLVHLNSSPILNSIAINGSSNTEVDVAATQSLVTVNGVRTVNVGNGYDSLANIKAEVDLIGSSLTDLTIHDASNPNPEQYNVYGSNVLAVQSSVKVGYSKLHSLTIDGGNQGNAFLIEGPPASTTLNTGKGSDNVFVESTTAPLIVNGQDGLDRVNIGLNGSTQFIGNSVFITNTGGYTAVDVDDSVDKIAQTGILYTRLALGLPLTVLDGLTPGGDISLLAKNLSSLTIHAGSGGNTFRIHDTPYSLTPGGALTTVYSGEGNDMVTVDGTTGPLFLNGDSGSDTVNIGSSGSVRNIGNTLTVTNSNGFSAVNVDDSADPSGARQSFTITALIMLSTAWHPGEISCYAVLS